MVASRKGGKKLKELAVLAAVLAAAQQSWAVSFTWLASPANNTWDTTSIDWSNGSNVAWADSASAPNDATFNAASASKTITLSGTIHVGNLTFLTTGWTLTGGTALSSATSGTLTISNSGTNTINAIIANNTSTAVTAGGTGTLIFGATNTYTGITTISGTEILQLGAAGNLGTGGLTFTAAGTFNLAGRNQTIGALNSAVGGTITDTGTSTLTITAANGSYNGALQNGTGKLLVTLGASASETLSATGTANSYSGATTIGSSANLALANGSNIVNSDVTATPGGTLTLNVNDNLNTQRTKSVTLTGGTLTQSVAATGTTTSASAGPLSLGTGSSTINVNPGTSGISTLNFSSLASRDGGSTVSFVSNVGSIGGANAMVKFTSAPSFIGSTVTTAGAANIGVIPYFVIGSTPTSFATYDSTVGVRALGTGEILTATDPTSLSAAAGDNVMATASIAMSADESINSLTLNAAATNISGSQKLTIASGGILVRNSATISTQTLDFNGAQAVIISAGATSTLTISSVIQNTGGLGLTKTGIGALTLSGINTYTGPTTIDSIGSLILNSDDSLGGSGNSGALVLNAASTVEFTNTFTSARNFIMNGSLETLQVDTSTTTLNGVLSGVAGVTKTGTGTLLVSNTNTYGSGIVTNGATSTYTNVAAVSGTTTTTYHPAGTLRLNSTGTLANTTVNVGSTGSMIVDSSSASPVTRTAALALTNGATLTVNGANGVATSDNFGPLTIGNTNGNNSLNVGQGLGEAQIIVNPGTGGSSTLNFTSLTRNIGTTATGGGTSNGGGATVVFSGTGLGISGGASKITFSTTPTLITTGGGTGILGYALVDTTSGGSGVALATYDNTLGVRGLQPGEYTTDPATISGATNGHLLFDTSSTPTITTSTANSLTLQNTGTSTTLGGSGNLTLGSGAILSTGSATNVINGPTLAFGSVEAKIFAVGNLTIDSNMTSSATSALTVSGPGTLTLAPSSSNTWAGLVRINSGTLSVSSSLALTGATAVLLGGNGATLQVTGDTILGGNIVAGNSLGAQDLASAYIVDVEGSANLSTPTVFFGTNTQDGFSKTGSGTLKLTAAASASLTGVSVVAGGTLQLDTSTATFAGETTQFMPGTKLNINSASLASTLTRMGATSFNAASINVTSGSGSIDQMGGLATFNTGASTVTLTPSSNTNSTGTLKFATATNSLTRNTGATVLFRGTNLGSAAGTNVTQVTFTVNPALTNSILPWALADTSATGNGMGFATVGANGVAVATTTTGTIAVNGGSTVNLRDTSTDNTAGSVNSLTLDTTTSASIGAGTVSVTSGGILNLTGTNSIDATTLDFAAKEGIIHTLSNLTINSQITGSGGLTKAGAGMLTLTSTNNTYTGGVTINSGTLAVSSDSNLGDPSNAIVLNTGGTLEATTGFTSSRNVTVNAGGNTTIKVDGGQSLTLSGVVSSPLPSTFAPASTVGTLAVNGGGTLVLNGVNTISGATTVSGSGTKLVVNSGSGGSLASSDVTVQANATIGGIGTLKSLTLQGLAIGAPGNSPGTQSVGSLTLANTSILNYDFGTAGAADHSTIGTSDRYAITGGANSLAFPSGGTVTLNLVSGSSNITGTGSYELLSYTNANAVSNFTSGDGVTGGSIILGSSLTGISGSSYSIVNDTTNMGIFLNFTVTGGGGGVPAGSGTWKNGAADGLWTTNTSANNNWATGIPNGADQVATFDDTVIGTPGTVDLNGSKTVGGIVLNTATNGYTIGTPATSSVLTMQTSSGNATISVSGGASHTINAPINLASSTDITMTSGTQLTLAGAVTGVGNLSLNGSGTLIVSASNNYGTTTLNGGTLGGSGTIAGAVTLNSGARIFPSAGMSPTSATTLTVGTLNTNTGGTLQFNLITPGSVNDQIVAGTLNLNGGTLDFTNHTTGASGVGYYKIMQYTTLTGSLSSMTLPATANSIAYFLTTSKDPGFVDVHRGYLGDANDSGFVDLTDLTILATNWQHSGNWGQGDFDGSGFVDLTDLTILAQHWQTGIGSFGQAAESLDTGNASWQAAVQSVVFAASVPEPTSLALLGLGAAGLLARRRRR